MHNFLNLYRHGFIKAAAAIPQLRVADPAFNAAQILKLAEQAALEHCALLLFPELCLSAYTNEDLFWQQALLESTEKELNRLLQETRNLNTVLVVGAPVMISSCLYNCALILHRGKILGIVPKTYLSNRQDYSRRQFSPAYTARKQTITYAGQQEIPFGSDLLFQVENIPHFIFTVEIGDNFALPIPSSAYAALAGATIILNPSASSAMISKANQRHALLSAHSARSLAALLYTSAGYGESTTDTAWDGHALIYENGKLLAEAERFAVDSRLIFTEIDLESLAQERLRQQAFSENKYLHTNRMEFRNITFKINLPEKKLTLTRQYNPYPFLPQKKEELEKLCAEAFNIQVFSLIKRMQFTKLKNIIIGLSGGLDSTLALLVAVQALDKLGHDRKQIRAYTMPGFATSSRTKNNARRLIQALGVYGEEIDIKVSSQQMLSDIGHPAACGKQDYDTTYENVQAGQRTSILFRLANLHHGLVLGTGDLSELALGWTTYGVGDHMSHYNVNAGVPKTLIRHLIHWQAQQFDENTKAVLNDIIDTEISPELIPGQNQSSEPVQRTEDFVGPYELQDFNLYYIIRYGFRPSKVAFLAYHAWRNKYTLEEIKHWLSVFLKRFFAASQFKRSALPNGPQIFPDLSLSPRGGWCAPSDSEATVWLADLEQIHL
ncbi:MAG: NAD(+) synthase [Firmicutes bacterium]|nr:NAD(+) synthase [Bacillota bacterium]